MLSKAIILMNLGEVKINVENHIFNKQYTYYNIHRLWGIIYGINCKYYIAEGYSVRMGEKDNLSDDSTVCSTIRSNTPSEIAPDRESKASIEGEIENLNISHNRLIILSIVFKICQMTRKTMRSMSMAKMR